MLWGKKKNVLKVRLRIGPHLGVAQGSQSVPNHNVELETKKHALTGKQGKIESLRAKISFILT